MRGHGSATRGQPMLPVGTVPSSLITHHSFGIVLRAVAELLHRVGDVPVAPAVGGDGVEYAEADLALDRPPGHLGAVARAEPHPAADLVARPLQVPADPQADHR